MTAGDTGGGAQVKSAVRTVELLEYFAGRPGMHSLAAVQEAVGYPKSSLYMLLRTLVELGWVETDATGTRYGIGVRALLVGTSYIDGDEVVAAARPTLDRLSDDTTETIHLARLDGTNVVYLATRQSQHYLRPFTRVGAGCPPTPRPSARRSSPRTPTNRCASCCRRRCPRSPGTRSPTARS